MGLSNFPTAAEGVLPVLVMNSVLSVTLLKNMVRSVIQVMCGANYVNSSNVEEDPDEFSSYFSSSSAEAVSRERKISITQFKSLCQNRSCDAKNSTSSSISGISGSSSSSSSRTITGTSECCVCLCGFEADEEVSELSCKHFFHKNCLDKWFHNKHTTCPLCRSID